MCSQLLQCLPAFWYIILFLLWRNKIKVYIFIIVEITFFIMLAWSTRSTILFCLLLLYIKMLSGCKWIAFCSKHKVKWEVLFVNCSNFWQIRRCNVSKFHSLRSPWAFPGVRSRLSNISDFEDLGGGLLQVFWSWIGCSHQVSNTFLFQK